jgi:hypothetical protein
VSWAFPGLITTSMGSTLPTYLVHLFGKQPRHPLDLHTACATVINPGSQPLRARLRVDLPVYAQPSTVDLAVAPGRTATTCLDPTFDLGKLYALRETTPGRLEVALTDAVSGAELGAAMRALALAPPGEIAWKAPGIAGPDMRDLAAVFVTPKDPAVDRLQRAAQEKSAWQGFGGGDPYQRPPLITEDTLEPGRHLYERLFLEEGESIDWEVLPGSAALDLYLFTSTQYEAWRKGTGDDAVQVWTEQRAGARGTLGAGGAYTLVVYNPGTATATARYRHDPTREAVVRDVLSAVYATLAGLGTRYSNIPDTYFGGWQHVRRSREVLEAQSANCIDGSLLFASVLELVGMEPVLILTTSHAYVAVRSAPGSTLVWPVETTLLDTAPFADAYRAGIDELLADPGKDPQFGALDIKALRARGILPMPQ